MRIINEKPPIWAEAHKHFDIDDSITFYTWGDILYNPAGIEVTSDLVVHEDMHRQQQAEIGGPEKWWRMYFDSRDFRAMQEAEAYGAQYRFFCQGNKDKNVRYRYLLLLSGFMASPLYKLDMDTATCLRHIQHSPTRKHVSPTDAVEPWNDK